MRLSAIPFTSLIITRPVHLLGMVISLSSLSFPTYALDKSVSASDRFGGPLSSGDVFPTTMEPLHPLNPADLARTTETMLQFGIQPDGRSLILGLPNFQLAISKQTMDFSLTDNGLENANTYTAKKYELGYGVSTTDLGFTSEGAPSLALGFNLRYLDFLPETSSSAKQVKKSFGDIGIAGSFRKLHADIAFLNLLKLSSEKKDSLPVTVPKEFNFGLAYGNSSDWLVSMRLGIQDFQDTATGQSIVDIGFEKLFFQNITFRIGSQRRYALKDNATNEIKSSISGGLWYRLNKFGKGYHYPDKDSDLFSQATLGRMLQNIELGGLVILNKTPETKGAASKSNTTLLVTLGKAF